MAQMGNASKADVMNLALNVYNMSQALVQGVSKSGGPSAKGISLDSNKVPTIYDSDGGQTQIARYSDIGATVDSSVSTAVSSAMGTINNTITSTVNSMLGKALSNFAQQMQVAINGVNQYLAQISSKMGSLTNSVSQTSSDLAQAKSDLSSSISQTNSNVNSINSTLTNSISQTNSNLSSINSSLSSSISQCNYNISRVNTNLSVSIAQTENSVLNTMTRSINNAINTACPAGTPLPWPSNNPPSGWLICNGANFNTSAYPQLSQAYPNGTLPDLRGMFIRGLDTTGNFDRDSGRQPLSYQEGSYLCRASDNSVVNMNGNQSFSQMGWDIPDQSLSGSIPDAFSRMSYSVGTFGTSSNPDARLYLWKYIGIARPKNVAFNYIVRAA